MEINLKTRRRKRNLEKPIRFICVENKKKNKKTRKYDRFTDIYITLGDNYLLTFINKESEVFQANDIRFNDCRFHSISFALKDALELWKITFKKFDKEFHEHYRTYVEKL